MIGKIFDVIRAVTIPICFLIFILMNAIFSQLYCGSISTTSWIFTIFWSLLLCGLITILPISLQRIGIILLVVLFSLMNIVHAVMYNLFGNFFSFSDLLYAGEGAAFFSLSYLNARKLLWITSIGAIVLSVFLVCNLKKRSYTIKKLAIGVILIGVGLGGIITQHNKIVANLNTALSWDMAWYDQNEASIYQDMTNKNHVMSMTGIYQYLYRSFVVAAGLENQLSNAQIYQELDSYYAQKSETVHQENEMSGIFSGKNAIFIMLESIDTWMLTEEYMPNLYRIQQSSIDFKNHYSPLYISAGTFNTEFIANTSLIPATGGVENTVYAENSFPYSIANCFNKEGYVSNSFHSSNPIIYNRGAIHENLGYIKYHNWVDMNMEDYMLDSQMINGYSKMINQDPFFSFIITYSGHGPYTEELSNISGLHFQDAEKLVQMSSIEASDEDMLEYTYAIAHAMETDDFVGKLLEQLSNDNLLDDTVLIFFTDHFGKYMTNHEFVMDLKNINNKDFLCNTPFFIYNSEMSGFAVNTVSSTVDILPTIANMFSLETDYSYYMGVDIFSDMEHYVIFQGNNWYDGNVYYTSDYEGEITEEIILRNREISEKMKYSTYVLKSDYYNHIK